MRKPISLQIKLILTCWIADLLPYEKARWVILNLRLIQRGGVK